MTRVCLECGAELSKHRTCMDKFHAFLVLDYAQPAYSEVHHLVVSTYMLQHPGQLSEAGWYNTHKLLTQFVHEGKQPAQIRSDMKKQTIQINMRQGAPKKLELVWSRTVDDVRVDSAEHYCEDVRVWAACVLQDLRGLVGETL